MICSATEVIMDLECPYCEKEIDDPDDCYEPCVDYEHECQHCEKNFVFVVEYTRHYSAKKSECLNGAPHQYKKTATYPPEFARMRCVDCGHEEDIEQYLKAPSDEPEKEPERFFPFEFEVWQGGEMVASTSGQRDEAMREAMHYAALYQHYGMVSVFEVKRTLVVSNAVVKAAGVASPVSVVNEPSATC